MNTSPFHVHFRPKSESFRTNVAVSACEKYLAISSQGDACTFLEHLPSGKVRRLPCRDSDCCFLNRTSPPTLLITMCTTSVLLEFGMNGEEIRRVPTQFVPLSIAVNADETTIITLEMLYQAVHVSHARYILYDCKTHAVIKSLVQDPVFIERPLNVRLFQDNTFFSCGEYHASARGMPFVKFIVADPASPSCTLDFPYEASHLPGSVVSDLFMPIQACMSAHGSLFVLDRYGIMELRERVCLNRFGKPYPSAGKDKFMIDMRCRHVYDGPVRDFMLRRTSSFTSIHQVTTRLPASPVSMCLMPDRHKMLVVLEDGTLQLWTPKQFSGPRFTWLRACTI